MILCAIRSMAPETSLRMAELCVAFKNRGVVGFDLAGAEINYPAKEHRAGVPARDRQQHQLHRARRRGVRPGVGAQAIHKCGAHRIGHGTRLVENGDLLNYVNDHRIPLEVCPSSNVQTRAAASLGDAPGRLLRRLRPARDDQHRQPADDRHDRDQGAAPVPQALRVVARRRSRRSSSRASRARSCRTARRPTCSPRSARELATYDDPRGEVTGRAGLVESDPTTAGPASVKAAAAKAASQV